MKSPGLFWILRSNPSRVAELVTAEEAEEEELDDEGRAMLVLLRAKVNNTPIQGRDWLVFRRYRLGVEMAALLSSHPVECPDSVVSFALRSRHRNVRDAAIEAVAQKVKKGHWKWITDFGKSSSLRKRAVFELLSLRDDIPLLSTNSSASAPRALQEFTFLQKISRAERLSEIRAALKAIRHFRPRSRTLILGESIARYQSRRLNVIFNNISTMGGEKTSVSLAPVRGTLRDQDFLALLRAYENCNTREAAHMEEESRFRRAIYESKATALATAILRTAAPTNVESLRTSLARITLTPSSQYHVLALLSIGSSTDVLQIIEKVQDSREQVQYWFQTPLVRTVEKRMGELGEQIPNLLRCICERKAFWEDPRAGKSKFLEKDLLPLRVKYNRALYVRLVAHTVIGSSTMQDSPLLQKLAQHEFHLIARAAAIRLTKLAGNAGLKLLQSCTTEAIAHGHTESFAFAFRDAEIQTLGLAELW